MEISGITPAGWEEITRIRSGLNEIECDHMHMTGMLQQIINGNRAYIKVIPYDGEWGEIDSKENLHVHKNRHIAAMGYL